MSDDEFSDQAAELDSPPPAGTLGDTDGLDTLSAPAGYTGSCVGGPLDGRQVTIRFPKGLLLVDRPGNRCWIYDRVQDPSRLLVREQMPQPLQDSGQVNRWRAAEQPHYDVLALDPATIGGEH